MISREEFERLSGHLDDLTSAVEGVGCELEALTTLYRAMVVHSLGEDPLAGTGYDDADLGADDLASLVPKWIRKRVGDEDQES